MSTPNTSRTAGSTGTTGSTGSTGSTGRGVGGPNMSGPSAQNQTMGTLMRSLAAGQGPPAPEDVAGTLAQVAKVCAGLSSDDLKAFRDQLLDVIDKAADAVEDAAEGETPPGPAPAGSPTPAGSPGQGS